MNKVNKDISSGENGGVGLSPMPLLPDGPQLTTKDLNELHSNTDRIDNLDRSHSELKQKVASININDMYQSIMKEIKENKNELMHNKLEDRLLQIE